ncbi:MAG: Ig-like domain-containing protein, partial [Candidatus Neomarinimicrobiota bacterium]|nr:Ig-like domain-containing protein [Candidatus Neomarinimicrobiota bacterium]
MKLFNSKKFILSLTAFYGIYNIYSCAAIQSPSGGPKDSTPPILLTSIPESGSTQFSSGKVDLIFSEYLQEKSINNAITILPITKSPAEIKYKGDMVSIYFPDSLLSNQTYIISINRELKDEHGMPIAQGIQLAFSTGERIDKSEISGQIFYNGKASSLLWKIKDSTDQVHFYKRLPDYNIDASDDGEYVFSYLSPGSYKVVGVDRSISGRSLDPGYAVYGLPWNDYITIDSINMVQTGINMLISDQPRTTRILSAQWVSNRWGKLTFDYSIDQYKKIILVDIVSDSFGVRAKTFIDNKEKNILHFVIPDSIKSGTKTIIDVAPVYQNTYTVIDSGKIFARIPTEKDTSYISITNHNNSSVLDIEENNILPLDIHFSKIMNNAKLDSAISLFKDSTLLDINMVWKSPMHLVITPISNWESLSEYSLIIIRDKLFSTMVRSIEDSIKTIKISTSKFKKFGSLTG